MPRAIAPYGETSRCRAPKPNSLTTTTLPVAKISSNQIDVAIQKITKGAKRVAMRASRASSPLVSGSIASVPHRDAEGFDGARRSA
jgi:hypothetical protein